MNITGDRRKDNLMNILNLEQALEIDIMQFIFIKEEMCGKPQMELKNPILPETQQKQRKERLESFMQKVLRPMLFMDRIL